MKTITDAKTIARREARKALLLEQSKAIGNGKCSAILVEMFHLYHEGKMDILLAVYHPSQEAPIMIRDITEGPPKTPFVTESGVAVNCPNELRYDFLFRESHR